MLKLNSFYNHSCVILVLIVGFFMPSLYAAELSKEDKIKASYVYNSIRFINWPKESFDKEPRFLNVCTFNLKSIFSQAFYPVVGKHIKGHRRQLVEIHDLKDTSHCQVIYLDESRINQFKRYVKQWNTDEALRKSNKTLFISDVKDFCRLGGMIGLVTRKGRVKLEVNLDVVKLAGFNISSNLLEVAKIISINGANQ